LDADVGAGHFIVAAADTVMNRPNAELMAEVFPAVPFRPTTGPYDTLLSIDRARRLLGYEPQHSWRAHVDACVRLRAPQETGHPHMAARAGLRSWRHVRSRSLPCLWRPDGALPPRRRLSAVSRLSGPSSPAPGRGSRAGAILGGGRSSPAAPASGPLGSPRGPASLSGRSRGRVGHVDPDDPRTQLALRRLHQGDLPPPPPHERAGD